MGPSRRSTALRKCGESMRAWYLLFRFSCTNRTLSTLTFFSFAWNAFSSRSVVLASYATHSSCAPGLPSLSPAQNQVAWTTDGPAGKGEPAAAGCMLTAAGASAAAGGATAAVVTAAAGDEPGVVVATAADGPAAAAVVTAAAGDEPGVVVATSAGGAVAMGPSRRSTALRKCGESMRAWYLLFRFSCTNRTLSTLTFFSFAWNAFSSRSVVLASYATHSSCAPGLPSLSPAQNQVAWTIGGGAPPFAVDPTRNNGDGKLWIGEKLWLR